MTARLRRIDLVQVFGILLIALVVAASATWRASGSPTPQIFPTIRSTIEVDPQPEQVDSRPEAVKLAEDVLGAKLQVSTSELPQGAKMTSPSADVRVICAAQVCAALRGGTDTYTYAKGKDAAAEALTLLLHPEEAKARAQKGPGRSR